MKKLILPIVAMSMFLSTIPTMAGTPGFCDPPSETQAYDPFHCLLHFNPHEHPEYWPGATPIWPAEMGEFIDAEYNNWRWYTREEIFEAPLGAHLYDEGTKTGWNAFLPDDPNCDMNPDTNPGGCSGQSYSHNWSAGWTCGPAPHGRPDLWTPRKEIIDGGYEMNYRWYNYREYEDGHFKSRIEFNITKLGSGYRVLIPVAMWVQNDDGSWGIQGNFQGDQPDLN